MSTKDALNPSQVQWNTDAPASGPPDMSQIKWDSTDNSAPETAGRVAGLGTRALGKGVADVGSMLGTAAEMEANPGKDLANAVASGLGMDTTPRNAAGDAMPADSGPYAPQLSDFVHPDKWPQAAEYFATKAGLPSPATPAERIGSKVVEALPSAVLAPETPILGALSAGAGAGASQGVAEMGGGQTAQTIAGLAAGSVPALGSAAGATLRGAVRGTSGADMRAAADNAAANNTSLTVGQASGNRGIQTLEAASGSIWGGGPIAARGEAQSGAMGSGVSKIVDNLNQSGEPLTPQSTGSTISAGVTSAKQSMRVAEKTAQNNVDSLVPPSTPVTVSGQVAEDHLTAQKNALEDAVQGSVIGGGDAATPTGAGQTIDAGVANTKQSMRASEKSAYDKVDDLVPPETPIPVSSTLAKLDQLSSPTPGAERTTAALVPKAITTLQSNIKADIAAAAGNSATPASAIVGADGKPLIAAKPAAPVNFSNGALPYSALTETRSKVGNSIDWGYSPADPVANGALKQVYGALTDDLNNGAAAVSPEAREAVGSARALYAANSDRRELLNSVIDRAGGPEAVYSAATSGLKGGATKLSAVMGALDPESQNTVRSTILQRMGANNGSFDSQTFLKNWSNLAPESKAAIVSDANMRNGFDRSATAHKNLRAQLQNGTAQMPYSALVAERNRLGAEVENSGLTPNTAAQKAHDKLSAEMNDGAESASPQAKQALDSARALHVANQQQRGLLDSVVGKAGGPEAVYQAATGGAKNGATKIGAVMRALDPDSQNIVRATVLDRLGRLPAGAHNAGQFDANRFLTGWNNVSPDAKDALFGQSGAPGSLRKSLDSLTDTISTIRNAKALPNPSGSGSKIAHAYPLWTLLGEVGTLAATGHWGAAGASVAGGLGAAGANNVIARALVNPRVVQWLAKSTPLPLSALPNAVNQLTQMGQKKQDPDAADLATLLSSQQSVPIPRATGGRVDHDALVERLFSRWKQAQRHADKATEPLLKLPDAAITRALHIAQNYPVP